MPAWVFDSGDGSRCGTLTAIFEYKDWLTTRSLEDCKGGWCGPLKVASNLSARNHEATHQPK